MKAEAKKITADCQRETSYVYVRSAPDLYTVGFFDPSGKWIAHSDHTEEEDAIVRVVKMNGGVQAMIQPTAPTMNPTEQWEPVSHDRAKVIVRCPECGEPITQPRNSKAYCENCGWPDEKRGVDPEAVIDDIASRVMEVVSQEGYDDEEWHQVREAIANGTKPLILPPLGNPSGIPQHEADEDAFNDWNRDVTDYVPSLWDAYLFGLNRGRAAMAQGEGK